MITARRSVSADLLNALICRPRKLEGLMHPFALVANAAIGMQGDTRGRGVADNRDQLVAVHEQTL